MDENQENLWQSTKAAKDHLFTQTAFLQQYGSGPAHGSDLSPRSRRSHTMPPVPVTSGPSPHSNALFHQPHSKIATGEARLFFEREEC